jgi:hypothetical protein
MKKLFPAFLFISFLLAGCETYFDVVSYYDRDTDFARYRTFAWLPDKDTSNSEYSNDIIRNNTRNYICHAMAERGYRLNLDTPDVLLELVLKEEKKVESVLTPTYHQWYYNPYYYPYPSPWFYRSPYYYDYGVTYMREQREFTESSITLNAIDRRKNQLVWTASAEADLYDPQYYGENMHPAIYAIMERYPVGVYRKKK